jgi:lipopolysaccharide biosynthesis glycosyltransferase
MQMSEPIVVVTGADENYAIGLAVTVRSMLEHLSPNSQIVLYVLDGGITEPTQEKIMQSWEDDRMTIHWLKPEMKRLEGLVTSGYLNHTTYLRLLIPDLLPASVNKVLYLDSDLLIRKDITELWQMDCSDVSVLAAIEGSSPYVDSEVVWKDQSQRYSRLGTTAPVANYRELGMNPTNKIFNAGILVINLEDWRNRDVPHLAYKCLHDYRDYVLFCDQYALNVVLADSWKEIDPRWNQSASFYIYEDFRYSPLDEETFLNLRDDPWICHFTSKLKPWWLGLDHPFQAEFVELMQKTSWIRHQLLPHPDSQKHRQQVVSSTDSTHLVLPRRKRTWPQWWDKRKRKLSNYLTRSLRNPGQRTDDHRKAA